MVQREEMTSVWLREDSSRIDEYIKHKVRSIHKIEIIARTDSHVIHLYNFIIAFKRRHLLTFPI